MVGQTILLLGGTREAVELAAELSRDPGIRLLNSLAGRTAHPPSLPGQTRIGGFGGTAGLIDYIRHEGVTKIIDATHPFATRISDNARIAARLTGVPLEVRIRPPWERQPRDRWITVDSAAEASRIIPSAARVFLAIGSQQLSVFSERHDVHFIIRTVDPLLRLPLPSCQTVTGKPPQSAREEIGLFEKYEITHLLCRNAGGDAGYAKIEAARMMRLPVIMIERPAATRG